MGGYGPTLEKNRVSIAHPKFSLFEVVYVMTAHPGFCSKILPYYDIYSILSKTTKHIG